MNIPNSSSLIFMKSSISDYSLYVMKGSFGFGPPFGFGPFDHNFWP